MIESESGDPDSHLYKLACCSVGNRSNFFFVVVNSSSILFLSPLQARKENFLLAKTLEL